MKKNLRHIYLAFSISLLITLITSLLLFSNLSRSKGYTQKIEHAHKVMDKISSIQYLLLHAESSQRGFLITLDSAYLRSLLHGQQMIYRKIDTLRQLTADNNVQQANAVKLRSAVARRLQLLNETIDTLLAAEQNTFYENDVKGRIIMQDFDVIAGRMENEELAHLTERTEGKKNAERGTFIYLLIILILSILVQIVSFIMIVREFIKRYGYQKQLEKKINELNMSHNELEQIAFIASHDLQEPLRKMRTFGGRLSSLYKDKDSSGDEANILINKIDASATRMQGLIEDLVDYTNLINSEELIETVNLNVCLNDVQQSLVNLIESSRAVVVTEDLPVIKGYTFQLQLLFTNLIHNAIKFSLEGVNPLITITAETIVAEDIPYTEHGLTNKSFLWIKVKDNGIGFENEFAKRIFVIFQRLHKQLSSYDGKGIGLAICKRVMTNHNGYISAESEPGKGATFNLYFPLY